jgi:hypothetical protein
LAPVEGIVTFMDKPYIDRTDYTCGEEQGAPSEGVAVGNLPRREIEPDKAVADLF